MDKYYLPELKNRIAPKQSDKTLQERLNEVCKKHAVSTLQDLDWAFCESEKGRARDFIEAVKAINHHKYKRCLGIAAVCFEKSYSTTLVKYDKESGYRLNFYDWWGKRWLALAEEPTWAKFLQLIHKEAK